jgi:hypothetical protein
MEAAREQDESRLRGCDEYERIMLADARAAWGGAGRGRSRGHTLGHGKEEPGPRVCFEYAHVHQPDDWHGDAAPIREQDRGTGTGRESVLTMHSARLARGLDAAARAARRPGHDAAARPILSYNIVDKEEFPSYT